MDSNTSTIVKAMAHFLTSGFAGIFWGACEKPPDPAGSWYIKKQRGELCRVLALGAEGSPVSLSSPYQALVLIFSTA